MQYLNSCCLKVLLFIWINIFFCQYQLGDWLRSFTHWQILEHFSHSFYFTFVLSILSSNPFNQPLPPQSKQQRKAKKKPWPPLDFSAPSHILNILISLSETIYLKILYHNIQCLGKSTKGSFLRSSSIILTPVLSRLLFTACHSELIWVPAALFAISSLSFVSLCYHLWLTYFTSDFDSCAPVALHLSGCINYVVFCFLGTKQNAQNLLIFKVNAFAPTVINELRITSSCLGISDVLQMITFWPKWTLPLYCPLRDSSPKSENLWLMYVWKP